LLVLAIGFRLKAKIIIDSDNQYVKNKDITAIGTGFGYTVVVPNVGNQEEEN